MIPLRKDHCLRPFLVMMKKSGKMPDDEYQFDDMDHGSFSKEEITIRSIILNHLKKICLLSCDEFVGGYNNTVTEWHGSLRYVKKVYVPDARAKYCQAVDTLYDLLLPFLDKEFLKDYDSVKPMKESTPDERQKKSRALFQILSKLLHRRNYVGE